MELLMLFLGQSAMQKSIMLNDKEKHEILYIILSKISAEDCIIFLFAVLALWSGLGI